ncbi:DUF3800 domain-containing protein [Streptomyces sp. WAC05374]|uniref:DUF3800 domain-containing protein n=1 Tax=Streptomyces sp. WAC05374 TaxID=2487420 RepID=UPI000F885DF7|nr:DUF3800 domain-containing protein [Streptomyces sp. WAC05374]RST07654.1 DUF3800 domain-containing protein [Streptomyces sp. WAC05374]TDF45163.1 DUF3800 domain-containing protein [Streptomyces sp. WAC05374]TDF55849.1 DUF3800 domain-containing protein [Streptomyces sp. WAC05374]TDF58987.1 DUF3800 domain-containing protein [Streptomyces sp. WAC05374]
MHICYLDESGGCEPDNAGPSATPVMVIMGLIVEAAKVPALTRDFLDLKRRHFPGRFAQGPALDHVLTEIKGSEILQMTRSTSRNKRRQAERIRKDLLSIMEAHDGMIVGRVWVKASGVALKPTPSYCYAVQDIARHFGEFLQVNSSEGLIIADGRVHASNVKVAHSIFTQKWRTGGDPFGSLREVPVFSHSENHVGIQCADLIASTLVFPMAASAYGPGVHGNPHNSGTYHEVRKVFGERVKGLQYRYRDETGKWRGGLVVSDQKTQRPGSLLFKP